MATGCSSRLISSATSLSYCVQTSPTKLKTQVIANSLKRYSKNSFKFTLRDKIQSCPYRRCSGLKTKKQASSFLQTTATCQPATDPIAKPSPDNTMKTMSSRTTADHNNNSNNKTHLCRRMIKMMNDSI